MKDALSERENLGTLNQLISQSIALDERYRERQREMVHQQQGSTEPPLPAPARQIRSVPATSRTQDPTGEVSSQPGRVRIPPSERTHRRRHGRCLFCTSPAHTIASCPVVPSGANSPGTPPGGGDSPTPGYYQCCAPPSLQAFLPVSLVFSPNLPLSLSLSNRSGSRCGESAVSNPINPAIKE